MSFMVHDIDESCPVADCTQDRDWCYALACSRGDISMAEFLSDPQRRASIDRIARSAARHYGMSSSDVDDAIAETLMVAAKSVDEVDKRSQFRSWVGYLSLRSQTAVRVLTESSAWTGVSGSSGIVRRRRSLLLYQSKRDPYGELTPEQLVSSYNTDLLARSPRAEEQGRLARVEDLRPIDTTSLDEYDFLADDTSHDTFDETVALVPSEAELVVELGTRACETEGLGEVAAAMYPGVDVSTVTEVARQLGISRAEAAEAMDQVNAVFRRVLADEFSITEA